MPYAPGIINNVGLYSKKYKSINDLPQGASVAIANDPINSGRGLQLLAKAGLISLKPGVGYKATEEDIITNPKKIKILQVEAVQLVRGTPLLVQIFIFYFFIGTVLNLSSSSLPAKRRLPLCATSRPLWSISTPMVASAICKSA